ncbi:MAG TPA: glycosyltransferase family 9 protein [Xanthobacteraceae bacterium]|jgi:heptosyltransferase-3|nr:glycosyltransferase family 9 protein [Xanthobacteraceae bacterium]
MTPLVLPNAPRVLVVALRRLGDVLLTTPLIHSIKRAYPSASIEALVFAGTEGILSGNPDLSGVITLPQRPRPRETLALLWRLARRYDLAVTTQTGDRPTAIAVAAGRQSAGPIEAKGVAASIKGFLLSRSFVREPGQHRVLEILRVADLLGIPAVTEIVCPQSSERPALIPSEPYAVIHANPMFNYKRWTADGWRKLAVVLRQRGLATVVTGAPSDRAYLADVWNDSDVMRFDGKVSWPDLSSLIGSAQVYVGPDTAITHLAVATGVPAVALFGPTDPRLWGPWPVGGLDPMWVAAGTIQQRGNVWLVQNPQPCLPCQLEGCERRLDSYSRCLDELTVEQVTVAVDQALAVSKAA